ncbi:MAG: S1 RNA-binding domain-containing protein, partial [Clostridia bacterium]|nr:S1 RNA-binding domain-containing protein [Clostridia bacterium]
ASPKSYREGMRLKARVISADPTGISVAIENGGKNDSGFIAKDEAEIDGSYDPANYPADTVLDVIIIPKESGDKNKAINLSKKAYDELKVDDEHVQRILAGEEFTLDHTQEIKGGLLGKIGTYTVFIPASQIKIGFVGNLSEYVNKPLRLKALPPREELDEEGNPKKPRNPKRIVASQRVILEAEKAARDEEFWSKVYVGAIVSGKVKRFADFGAFVSLKYMDGLVHNSDLSWSKRRDIKPADVLEINKVYDFIVLSVDRENGKIGLGYKQLQKKPIEIAQEKYPIGTIVTGKVAKIMKYGVFVELEPGLDGLVHISQIQHGYLENINDAAVKEGDIVNVKVMNYENDKITLSIKETLPIAEVAPEVETVEADANGAVKGKKGKKVKEESDEGPHNFVSGGSKVSLGSFFENLNIHTDDNKDE